MKKIKKILLINEGYSDNFGDQIIRITSIHLINKLYYDLLFMFLIALAVSVSVQIVGVLLITSLLIIPPAIARVFSNSPVVMIFTSMLVSIGAVLLGLYLSIDYDLATGPTIVIALGALFFIAQFLPKKI